MLMIIIAVVSMLVISSILAGLYFRGYIFASETTTTPTTTTPTTTTTTPTTTTTTTTTTPKTIYPKKQPSDWGYRDGNVNTSAACKDMRRGWYDISGQGVANDYCRCGGNAPSGDDPGSLNWTCELATPNPDATQTQHYKGSLVNNQAYTSKWMAGPNPAWQEGNVMPPN